LYSEVNKQFGVVYSKYIIVFNPQFTDDVIWRMRTAAGLHYFGG